MSSQHNCMHPIAMWSQLIKQNCQARYIIAGLSIYKNRILLWSAHFCKETVHNVGFFFLVFFFLLSNNLHLLAMHITFSSVFQLPSAIYTPYGQTGWYELPKGQPVKDGHKLYRYSYREQKYSSKYYSSKCLTGVFKSISIINSSVKWKMQNYSFYNIHRT